MDWYAQDWRTDVDEPIGEDGSDTQEEEIEE